VWPLRGAYFGALPASPTFQRLVRAAADECVCPSGLKGKRTGTPLEVPPEGEGCGALSASHTSASVVAPRHAFCVRDECTHMTQSV